MGRPELRDAFVQTRQLTEQLASVLSAEDQVVQSMPDVSPTKWHRAHTTWFFETFVLEPFAPAYEVVDPLYGFLFNSYYEAVGARHPRPRRGMVTRPSVEEVAAYRAHVDSEVVDLLDCGAPDQVAALVELGIHHEQQHQELLLMDIHHVLGSSPVLGAYGEVPWTVPEPTAPPGWRSHEGGIVTIGHEGSGFSFDNEGPRHEVLVRPFELSTSLVTNAEFAAFIDDGGYEAPALWMSDGAASVTAEGWRAPMSWLERGGQRLEHTLHGLVELDPAAPVRHVSWFEADAYARWAGARLPSEAEWEALAPSPEDDDAGFYGLVWQWTMSPYVAYPRFVPAPGAVGEYNGKFMVNQMTLRGSSLATPPGHARRTYRNFFPPAARWAFSGLRLARDA